MNADEHLVVDAQVVHYHYQEDLGQAPPGSGSAVEFFAAVRASRAAVYLDSGGHVYEEWSRNVSDEWFDGWFTELASTVNLREIDAPAQGQLFKRLSGVCGFPKSENWWLVRVAVSAATESAPCALVTEDMDFREPSQKGCSPAVRDRYLSSSAKGSVTKELWKHWVEVISLKLALG